MLCDLCFPPAPHPFPKSPTHPLRPSAHLPGSIPEHGELLSHFPLKLHFLVPFFPVSASLCRHLEEPQGDTWHQPKLTHLHTELLSKMKHPRQNVFDNSTKFSHLFTLSLHHFQLNIKIQSPRRNQVDKRDRLVTFLSIEECFVAVV